MNKSVPDITVEGSDKMHNSMYTKIKWKST